MLTAFVLKALLKIIIKFEHKVGSWFDSKKGKFFESTGTITTLLILFFSKFLILEIIDFIFEDDVVIKEFIPLAAMIITMIATRKILEGVYKSL